MAREINEIQEQLLAEKANANELTALDVLTTDELSAVPNSASRVAEWRLMIWVVSMSIWTLEKLFDIFKIEVEERIAATRVHTRKWYREMALLYQYGDTLNESDKYAVIDETKQIVKYAAVRRVILSGHGALRVKVAKDNAGDLVPLEQTELDGFTAYMNKITDAGTMVMPTSTDADTLKVTLDVYYNPELVGADGNYLDGSGNCIIPTINAYLKSIEFDGQLILTKLTDAMQLSRGVAYPVLKSAHAKISGGAYNAVYDLANGVHNEFYNPDAGYMKLNEADTVINYLPYNAD